MEKIKKEEKKKGKDNINKLMDEGWRPVLAFVQKLKLLDQ